jgi:hypothetical protein
MAGCSGLSLTKLRSHAIIVAVWYGFKIIGQVDRARKEAARLHRAQAARRKAAPPPPKQVVEDMVKAGFIGRKAGCPFAGIADAIFSSLRDVGERGTVDRPQAFEHPLHRSKFAHAVPAG